ncbi:hypothetical protein M4951_05640 [Blastopirellula sp. J2-11]|uniref:hypothetical protein n=1 Tax=Blastopirellula sp. J2-11 TaxID=2943192 RepID=UPI0021C82827|nr:hypothetical protein [Blastopirellula sp. J2-11]UUO07791.1 hypothetical protein M4951_05640 [Blastopirellula sp. J2-11]
MDLSKRQALIEHIQSIGGLGMSAPAPVVTIDAFFDGNDDYGSIGCNLTDHPGPQGFYETLRSIRDRSDVVNVLVQIYEVEEDDVTMWPFSERVFIVTKADLATIAKLLVRLQPSEIDSEYPLPPHAEQPPEDCVAYAVWWD